MNQGLIPRRYAKALYKVATERGVAERMYELMNKLSATFDADNGLRSAVDNPFVPVADKTSLLITAAGATDADTTYVDFLKLLVENRRVDIIESIARSYADLYRKEGNIRRVE
ncbi:MAG: ATP synthase F1 subunit delta, partial [Muribaculaceae bacterium]|nr:ATP synthase F1 subunit delta [Muribaculaceae bacterium]